MTVALLVSFMTFAAVFLLVAFIGLDWIDRS